jgi:hypothetical protein
MLAANQKTKDILEGLGISYPAVAGFLGGNQPFHRTRVNASRCYHYVSLPAEIMMF